MSNFTLRCILVIVLQAVVWQCGSTDYCYRQRAAVTRSRKCHTWLWTICSNTYSFRYYRAKVCCDGWTGDNCNILKTPAFISVIRHVSFATNETKLTGRSGEYQITSVYFLCNFQHSSQDKLQYRVTWYENGFKRLVSDFGESQNDIKLRLAESQFYRNGFSLGNQLSCDVQAYAHKDSPPGRASNRSKELFIGIELLTREVFFNAGESGIVQFRPTIPIGCHVTQFCEITVKALLSDEAMQGACSGIAIEGRRCGIKLQSKNSLDTVYELRIKTAENGQYQTKDGYYEIFLEVDAGFENEIWRNYKLPKIHVHMNQIQRSAGFRVHGKRCHSDNDPRTRTFDGMRYGLNEFNAIYTLYKHTVYDAEIQIRLKQCNRGLCNCGIAVRSGRDVYKIDLCTSDLFMNYLTCGDNTMKVKSKGEWKYKIFMPYGTYAEVDIQRWRRQFLNIRVQPSLEDAGGKSAGLCGSLDNNKRNDFQLRDGTVVGVTSFTRSWIVTDETQNMFSKQFKATRLAPLPYEVCVCKHNIEAINGDPRLGYIACESNAVATCIEGKVASADSCAPKTRFRRSLHRNPYVPKVRVDYLSYEREKSFFKSRQHIQKKEFGPDYAVSANKAASVTMTISGDETREKRTRQTPAYVWKKEDAENFCQQHITKSSVYKKCTDVPNVRTQEAIDNCALDLVLTQDTGWANVSMEAMQSACLSELQRNTTLRHSDDPNIPSIAEQIEKIACVNNCSMVGDCVDGACQCKQGYGGSDCSVDLNESPVMAGLLDKGLCDVRELNCSHGYAFGHFFVDSENLTCKLFEFELTIEGNRTQLAEKVVKARFDTFLEVICPLDGLRRKRSVSDDGHPFVYGYTIHVSNDGVLYSDGKDIYIYNSECQQPTEDTEDGYTAFVLTEGFCFINGQCYNDGDFDTHDNCSVCDSRNNKLRRSTDHNRKECDPTDRGFRNKGSRHVWVIRVILPIVVLADVIIF